MNDVQFIAGCIAASLITVVICLTVVEVKKYKIDKILGAITAVGLGICNALTTKKN